MKGLQEEIVNNNNLIYSLVKRFTNSEYEDYYQAGVIGLIEAYNTYDQNKNTKFSSYAYNFILGSIYNYHNKTRPIKLNEKEIKLKKLINKAEEYLTNKLNKIPSDIELANFINIDLYTLNNIKYNLNTNSLDYLYENNNYYDYIKSNDNIEENIILKEALNKLNKEELELILKRYYYNKSQTELAKEINKNQVSISREENKILKKLRKELL